MFSLLRSRDFGLLWLAGLISFTGTAALIFALPLHIYRETDSTLAIAGSLVANYLPRVLFSSLAGVFVDRWDRQRTMVVVDAIRAVTLLPILLAPNNLLLLYAAIGIQGTLATFFLPAEGALLPKLVGKEHLVTANALNSLNNNIGMLIGPAMGTLLYAYVGIGGTVLTNTATFAGSALLISLITADARPERDEMEEPDGSAMRQVVAEWIDGLGLVRSDRVLMVTMGSSVANFIADGVFVTLSLSPLVLDVLGGTPEQVGWMGSAQAVGGLTAGMIVVRLGHRMSKRLLLGGGLIGIGLSDLGAANARLVASAGTPAVGVAMGCMAAAGLPAMMAGTGRLTVIQDQTEDAYRGRVFGTLGSAAGLSLVVGLILGGLLGDAVGLVAMLSMAAILRIAGGLFVFAFMPRTAVTTGPAQAESSTPPDAGPAVTTELPGP